MNSKKQSSAGLQTSFFSDRLLKLWSWNLIRPKSIKIFELVFVAECALEFWYAFSYGDSVIDLIILLCISAIFGWVVLLISRKRSIVAIWIFVLSTVATFVWNLVFLFTETMIDLDLIFLPLVTILHLASIVLLFIPSTRQWLANEKTIDEMTKT